ncbi:hypothetical protein BH23CHL5_BH23CHL5_02600 [soil metagenome]
MKRLAALLAFATVAVMVSTAVNTQATAQDDRPYLMTASTITLPDDFTDAVPVAIVDTGDVLLNGSIEGVASVLLWRDGAFSRLSAPTRQSHATAMHRNGQVVGWVMGDDEEPIAAILEEGRFIEMPGADTGSRAFGTNGENGLVGEALFEESDQRSVPVYWTSTSVEVLPGITEDSTGRAHDVNTIGQIAGWIAPTGDLEDSGRATLWFGNQITDLGLQIDGWSAAFAINETGQVVGVAESVGADDGKSVTTATLWQDGQPGDLGVPDGFDWAEAVDISDSGLIVGTAGTGRFGSIGGVTTAVLWTVNDRFDLNESTAGLNAIQLTAAVSVNTFGQILCAGLDEAGRAQVVILTVLGN